MNTNANGFRIIPTKVHGVLDYLTGIALLVAPNIFGFAEMGGPAVWIPRILGLAILGMSVFTQYELGLIKVISVPMHLLIDVIAALFLATSPFVFGFSDNPANVWLPHVAVGLGYLVITLLTQTEPSVQSTPINLPD